MTKFLHSKTSPDQIVFGLYGAGGLAREVMPLVVEYMLTLTRTDSESSPLFFFVETEPRQTEINGYPLISEREFFDIECRERYFNVAIGDSALRARIAARCIAEGAKPISLISKNAIIYDNNVIGEGAVLCAHTMITSNAQIGKFFQSNIYSYVAHDCVIGDHVTFAPSVHCNGNVHIHDHAYIGTGAIIKQGTPTKPLVIGEGAIVGMGAVVTKDVAPFTTVVGNPAKPFLAKPNPVAISVGPRETP
jgi:sugar O-acyltransferase (sialic acid O-acetyltransferase NeuD family)